MRTKARKITTKADIYTGFEQEKFSKYKNVNLKINL